MTTRTRLTAILAGLALALSACGGDDEKKDEPAGTGTDTTEQTAITTAQGDPAAKAQLQEAVGGYNRGYDKFFAALKRTSSLEGLKAVIADYRTVIYEFDKDLRAIEFDDSLVPQVNAILESNRGLIAQLDEIGNAGTFGQAQKQYEAFLKDRGPTVAAVNRLMDEL
jgi:hypothetical protein